MSYEDERKVLEQKIKIVAELATLEAELINAKAAGDTEAIKRTKNAFQKARTAYKEIEQSNTGESVSIRPPTIQSRSGVHMPGENN